MDTLFKDVRFGARMLFKNRGSTTISVVALGLGIGLTTLMFSIIWGAILRGLPFEEPQELVAIWRTNLSEDQDQMGVSIHDFEDWRAQQKSFEDIAAYYTGTVNVSGLDKPERFDGAFITPEFLTVLGSGVRPFMGRALNADDAGPGAEKVMLISHDLWQNRFASDPDIIGRVVRANAQPTTIVGVMPEGFAFPENGQVWVPLPLVASSIPRNEGMWLDVVGRLRDGVSLDQANVEMAGIAGQIASAYPETNEGISAHVDSFVSGTIGDEPMVMLYTMLGATFMVLLIACANVANLLISRAAIRTREVGIRTAMGASKLRIVRQFLTESFLIAIGGALLGLGIAWIGIRLFNNAIAPTNPPFWIDIRLDGMMLLFVLAVAAVASFLAGGIPAWQAARANVSDVLKDESRGASSFRLGRISRALVVVEIALSAGLLVGAGLMIKSVTKITTVDFAFETDQLFTARVGLPEAQYPDSASQAQFWTQLEDRLRGLPNTSGTALISGLPGVGVGSSTFQVEGATYENDNSYPFTRTAMITPGALSTLEVTLLSGRGFTEQDTRGSLPVAIVNESFVEKYFAGQDVIGRRVRMGGANSTAPWLTIVGVMPDMYLGGLDDGQDNPDGLFTPLAQGQARFMTVIANARSGDPLLLSEPVRDVVLAVDPDLPIYFVRTLRNAIDNSNWFYMVFGTLFMVFGGVALFLAAIGLYGVMSTSVSQRTREMGVRMALGAQARDVLSLVMRQGVIQVVIGLVLGLIFAIYLSKGLQILLFEVNPRDPVIFLSIGGVLAAVALVACFIPASRATRVDPLHALRYD